MSEVGAFVSKSAANHQFGHVQHGLHRGTHEVKQYKEESDTTTI